MPIESATYISDLNPDWPTPQDFVKDGDDQMRLTKKVLQNTWPNMDAPVTATPAEINNVALGFRWLAEDSTASAPAMFQAMYPEEGNTTPVCLYADTPTLAELNAHPNLIPNWSNIRDILYPVGCEFSSYTDSRNPKDILGFGTWVAVVGLIAGIGSIADTAGLAGSYLKGQQKGYWRVQNSQIVGADLTLKMDAVDAHAHNLLTDSNAGEKSDYALSLKATGTVGVAGVSGPGTVMTTNNGSGAALMSSAGGHTPEGKVTIGSGAANTGTAFYNPYYGKYIWTRTA